MNYQQQEVYTQAQKSRITLSFEGKFFLIFFLITAVSSLYFEHEFLFYISCLCIASHLGLWLCLPNPSISFHLKSLCPPFFQAGGQSTHRLTLSASYLGGPLPYLVITAKHKQHKDQMIKSSQNKISKFTSNHYYDIAILVEPQTQGQIEFEGIFIRSNATWGLYTWEHFIPLSITRPVHPRQIALKPLQYLKHFWGESDLLELHLPTQHQGEYIGWPRAYQPGDPLSSINWKRLAQNSFEPIVHSAITSESHEVTILIDTALSIRKRGAQYKLHRVCEFARSLTMLLEKEGATLQILICSATTSKLQLNSKSEWIDFLNQLSMLKVTKKSTATYELEQLALQKNVKVIHLSLEPSNHLITSMENQRHVHVLNYTDIMFYSLEPLLDHEEEWV